MRQQHIQIAIESLPDGPFQDLAFELLRRELYPGLNRASHTHDLGEDAYTDWSTLFMHDGKWVSVFSSITAEYTKLQLDCLRCKATGRRIDTVVFATNGDPTRAKIEEWGKQVQDEFGWNLEVRTIRWYAPVASSPDNEDLASDYLQVPPLDGDWTRSILDAFQQETEKALPGIRRCLSGTAKSIPRPEVRWIEEQLEQGRPVLLTGEAGTGKSAIGATIALSAQANGTAVLFLDTRRLAACVHEVDMRRHLGLNGHIAAAIARMGRLEQHCLVVIDQLDWVAGTPAATVLVELATECAVLQGVRFLAISRRREQHEIGLLSGLTEAGFVELTSHPLDEDRAREALTSIGILEPSPELVALAQNLLNLDLISQLRREQPSLSFSILQNEMDLWERYLRCLSAREGPGALFEPAEQTIAEACRLARLALLDGEGRICLDYPMPHEQRRLVSWEVLTCEGGRVHVFRHEKLQEYLYAWDSTEKRLMPRQVIADLGPHRSRNVLIWMEEMYSRQNSQLRRQFWEEVFSE
jgi:hypothetical protein